MRHKCEVVVRHILPAFRSLIARGLIEEHGFTQDAAAKKLGTTQAAISYYLSSKRGVRYVKEMESTPLIKEMIKKIVDGIASENLSSSDIIEKLCDLCNFIRSLHLINTSEN